MYTKLPTVGNGYLDTCRSGQYYGIESNCTVNSKTKALVAIDDAVASYVGFPKYLMHIISHFNWCAHINGSVNVYLNFGRQHTFKMVKYLFWGNPSFAIFEIHLVFAAGDLLLLSIPLQVLIGGKSYSAASCLFILIVLTIATPCSFATLLVNRGFSLDSLTRHFLLLKIDVKWLRCQR